MDEPSSLLNLSKRQLAEQHEALVLSLMRLWGVHHRMADWRDPRSAVETLFAEAAGQLNGPARPPDGGRASSI
jgi:hypothetical protein